MIKKHEHYFKDVSGVDEVDVYKVCELFGVQDTSGAVHHAIKKLLCSGKRGTKSLRQDIQEAVDTLNRKLQMLPMDPVPPAPAPVPVPPAQS